MDWIIRRWTYDRTKLNNTFYNNNLGIIIIIIICPRTALEQARNNQRVSLP
jgi:hypothetical protein